MRTLTQTTDTGAGTDTRTTSNTETGSGTVAALGIIAALLVMLGLVHAVSAASSASAQAARAADLAALAAADAARGLFSADPCAVAEELTSRNQAQLLNCTVVSAGAGSSPGPDVELQVRYEVSLGSVADGLRLPPLAASASARAGPPP